MPLSATVIILAAAIGIVIIIGYAFEALCRAGERAIERECAKYARYEDARPRRRIGGPDDFDRWLMDLEEERLHRERNRLATTGELRKMYERPYPGELSDTGELRALAEAGDLGGVREILGRWAAENLEDTA
jgi:hypothetical protein